MATINKKKSEIIDNDFDGNEMSFYSLSEVKQIEMENICDSSSYYHCRGDCYQLAFNLNWFGNAEWFF